MMQDANDLQKQHFDIWLLLVVVGLVACGVTMVYSASAVLASERYQDSYYFLKRSLIYVVLGFSALTWSLRFDYHRLRRWVYPVLFGSVALVGLTFIPGVSRTIGGATRWINLGFFSFQPSELAKLGMILFLAYSLEKKVSKIRQFSIGVLPHMLVAGFVAGSIFLQRDFGSAAIIFALTWCLMFSAGARLRYLLGFFAVLIPVASFIVMSTPYRRQRVLAFLNPWSDQFGSGFQMIQSFVAFSEGGWFGRGLGEGQQKLFYLPEAHTDFIFSVVGEELGLIGVAVIILLFAFFCFRGFRVALHAPDLFGRFLALGGTLLIGTEAVLNMGVVMGLLPTKGLALPFLSYGGSSMVVSLLIVGVLLNVSSYRSGYGDGVTR